MIEKSLTCTFMIHSGIWFSSANFVGKIFLNTWYFEKKKNILKCAYLLLRKWKNWSLSFKKALVSPFSLLKYNWIQVIFFSIKILEWQINRCNCISWQYLVIWSVVYDMKSFSCGNRILLQCCEYAW